MPYTIERTLILQTYANLLGLLYEEINVVTTLVNEMMFGWLQTGRFLM